MINEKIKSLPNGLKKRLISNLILDAVLDKAMSEKFPDSPPPRPQEEEEETEKENKEDSSEKIPDKKKSKAVKKGKGKKSDRVEENGLEDGDSSNKLESGDSAEDSNNRLEETEHKISSDCDVTSLDMTDGLATSEPDLGDKPEIIVGCRPPEDKEDTSTLPSAQTSRLKEEEEKPPTPVQHSVFKSFFSTELSFDDIDRQIEAKRVELVSLF